MKMKVFALTLFFLLPLSQGGFAEDSELDSSWDFETSLFEEFSTESNSSTSEASIEPQPVKPVDGSGDDFKTASFESFFEDEKDAIDSALDTFKSEPQTFSENVESEPEPDEPEPLPESLPSEGDDLAALLRALDEDPPVEEVVNQVSRKETLQEAPFLLEDNIEADLLSVSEDSESSEESFEDDSIYAFGDYLMDATAVVIYKGRGERLGRWKNNRFSFSALGRYADIEVKKMKDEKGKRINAFQFNPVPRAKRRITFSNVTPGQSLKLYYKVEAEIDENQKISDYLYLRIWIGKHNFGRIRIPIESKEWQSREIPFGVVQFLNRNIVVTFELTSDTPKQTQLFLSARI